MRNAPCEGLDGAASRIEHWLLYSGAQLDAGPHRGGVAGWLDGHGRPEFVYLEITGYYLTAVAWLARGASTSQGGAERALERGQRALQWMRSFSAGQLPPTRLYLETERPDWRNAATFSFDLAMAARGAACFAAAGGRDEALEVATGLSARLAEISDDGPLLVSHALRDGGEVPDRWSTRPGPHHLKAAAALLGLPDGVLPPVLAGVCRQTVDHWTERLAEAWPCRELHPTLYGLEGLLMLSPSPTGRQLEVAGQVCQGILALQRADGSLPAEIGAGSAGARSDVLAQTLRAATLVAAARHEDLDLRLDRLAEALLRHVRPDGGVLFSLGQDVSNTWCAMMAHQALVLHAQATRGQPLPAEVATTLI